MVPSSQLLEYLTTRYPNLQRAPDELNDTARSWKIPGYHGSIGFISSMSDHFCSSCNRLRITADGQIKVCCFSVLLNVFLSCLRSVYLTPRKCLYEMKCVGVPQTLSCCISSVVRCLPSRRNMPAWRTSTS
jgi:Molybdenum Cofactor Synthesis C